MRKHQKSEGQALVLVALVSVVLVAMVGLGIDGGNYFMQQRTVTNVGDAAALAATRAFLEAKREGKSNSATNKATYDAAANFIAEHLNMATTTFSVSYYLNNNDATNRYYTLSGTSDGTSLPSQKKGQELLVRGVEVEISYTFNTFFMQIMRYNTGTVGAKGLGYFGYLGSVVGEDVVPLGIDMSAGNELRKGGEFSIHVFGSVLDPLKTYNIYNIQTAILTFKPNDGAEEAAGCGVVNTLAYTWCAGSSTPVQIAEEFAVDDWPFNNSLKSYVNKRIASGKDVVLLPEYFGDPSTGNVTISSFVAVKLVKTQGDALIVEYMPYVYTSGSISGNGNGIPGAYAINLVR